MDTTPISSLYIMKQNHETTNVILQPKSGEPISLEVRTSNLLIWISKKIPTDGFPYSGNQVKIYTAKSQNSCAIKEIGRGEAISLIALKN